MRKPVFRLPLRLFSMSPMTGFYRDGYCRVGAEDYGEHAVAGVVTDEFLDFSASRGNDLRAAGLTHNCRWCLCTSRWLEALEAFRMGRITRDGVPKVNLEATDQVALERVDLATLRQFAVVDQRMVNGMVNGI